MEARGVSYFMVDQAYAASILKYDDSPQMTPRQKLAYYMGVVTPVCPMWYVATYAGAVLGDVIPPTLPIDFAVPITFLALIVPMLRSLAHVVAALVSIIGVLVFAFVPFNLGCCWPRCWPWRGRRGRTPMTAKGARHDIFGRA